MPINQLVQYCILNALKKKQQCNPCPNKEQGICVCKNCSSCFSEIFFTNRTRRYNCLPITYNYVCRFIYQFSSEFLYLLNKIGLLFELEQIKEIEKIKIMSIGCGPCCDIFAFDTFFKNKNIKIPVEYFGYDTNNIWSDIHEKIKEIKDLNISLNVFYEDCFSVFERDEQGDLIPNILVISYLFSDFLAHGGDLNQFIDNIVSEIIDKMPVKSIVILNDINSGGKSDQPRDYFVKVIEKANIKNNLGQKSFYFNGYKYGEKHDFNSVILSLSRKTIDKMIELFGTRTVCTSAQLVIRKRSNI